MVSSDPVTLTDVLSFIGGHADPDALDTILGVVRDRRRALADVAAHAVRVGATVRLHSLSPRYLNGLTGTVTAIPAARRGAKRRCTIRLDQTSVTRLAQADSSYAHLREETSYEMGGIPVAACHLVDS
jgi:hypothetical protein